MGRTTRMQVLAVGLALGSALGSACAGTVLPVAPPSSELELARLHDQLGARDQTIQQLEGRLALLEAEQRELRDRLGAADSQPRSLARPGACEREPEAHVLAEPAASVRGARETRPMLKLYSDRAERAETASWVAPSTHERLEVAPLPAARSLMPAAPLPPASAALPATQTSAAADELYERALNLLQRREFAEALRELDAFLRSYPEDGRGVRAQVWRGEILFGQREYMRALVAYEQALKRDPAGKQAAECLLWIARCHFNLGAAVRGRAALAQLKAQFPDSEAARRADQVMREDT